MFAFDLYVAACDREGGILHYRMARDGSARLVDRLALDRPMHMIPHGDALAVLLLDAGEGESALVRCPLTADGHLGTPEGAISTHGREACHLVSHGGAVYAVNYSSSSLIRLPDRLVERRGSGPHPRQRAPHPHHVSPTPDGRYLAVVDLGTDEIVLYRPDLTEHAHLSLPAGTGPRHLSWHADGRHAFCISELASTVTVLTYEDGRLSLGTSVSILPHGAIKDSFAAAIRCVGDTVYATVRGHDTVAVLDFDGKGLALRRHVPVYGAYPRDLLVLGDLLICANEREGGVTVISQRDGTLLSRLDAPRPVCLVARETEAPS